MDVDALLEAFQDFEKKAKMETCPVLEQFLCHVAKTGQPLILWSQLKQYFMFKLEKVMDDFHASTPEQRVSHNPNVEHVPFEEMKTRILKIVDGYNGVPFTIQRLCELVMDPNRNYAGTDKFLRGLEKNVRVVSFMYPTSEKNGASSVNRMNGVMFPGNSSPYSDSRNVNGPATPKPLNRPRFSLSTSLSTNGLPDGPVGKEPEPEPTTEEVEEHHMSDPSRSEAEDSPSSGTKNKHPEEEGDSDDDKQEVKRLKFDEKEEEETENEKKESLCLQESENLSEMPDSLEVSRGQDNQSGTSCDSTCDQEPSSTGTETTEREGSSSETADVHTEEDESAVDGPEPPAPSSFEQDNEESNSGICDGEDPASDKEVPSSSSSSPDLSTEGDADSSHSTDTAVEPGEQQD